MSSLFYSKFNIEHRQVFSFLGDALKYGLITQLAREAHDYGLRPIILSLNPMPYPVEGKVLLCDQTSMLMGLIESEAPTILYIASGMKNDQLLPLQIQDIGSLMAEASEVYKFLIDINNVPVKELRKQQFLKKSQLISVINFKQFESASAHSANTVDGDYHKTLIQDIHTFVDKNCRGFKSLPSGDKRICYISEIRTMYEENIFLPLGRALKETIDLRLLYGSLSQYSLREIT